MNNKKAKGTAWETDAVNLLNTLIEGGKFKRVPGSGALGSSLAEPLLQGDIVGTCKYPRTFRIEAKVGYGGEKQFTLKREWLEKIRAEAEASFSIPLLIGKFSGARSGVKHFIVMDLKTFAELMNEYGKLREENDKRMG